MANTASVVVEFFGVPRLRAGRAELAVPAGTVGEVLASVRDACPQLADLLRPDGRLSLHYLLSLDGRAFVSDVTDEVPPNARLLLLSADAGG